MSLETDVAAHYGRADLGAAILGALERAGKDLENLTADDLAPVDQFHVRGREATVELARALDLTPDMRVLDVGCGIGGAARYLAHAYGCRVVGIDLTNEYCRVATMLTERVGLSDRVEVRQGNALALPFAAGSFDAAITQHVAMNIPDKAALYAEVARVLRPGAPFGLYDLMDGGGGEVLFPVPWARVAANSFLAAPGDVRRLLEGAGFRIASARDVTEEGRAFFEAILARVAESGPPPLGLHLLLGPDFKPMAQNVLRNLAERRVVAVEIICRKS